MKLTQILEQVIENKRDEKGLTSKGARRLVAPKVCQNKGAINN